MTQQREIQGPIKPQLANMHIFLRIRYLTRSTPLSVICHCFLSLMLRKCFFWSDYTGFFFSDPTFFSGFCQKKTKANLVGHLSICLFFIITIISSSHSSSITSSSSYSIGVYQTGAVIYHLIISISMFWVFCVSSWWHFSKLSDLVAMQRCRHAHRMGLPTKPKSCRPEKLEGLLKCQAHDGVEEETRKRNKHWGGKLMIKAGWVFPSRYPEFVRLSSGTAGSKIISDTPLQKTLRVMGEWSWHTNVFLSRPLLCTLCLSADAAFAAVLFPRLHCHGLK